MVVFFLSFLLSVFLCVPSVSAGGTVLDYFFPVGESSYGIYMADSSKPYAVGKAEFVRNLTGGKLVVREFVLDSDGSPARLADEFAYSLVLSDTAVTAKTWTVKSETDRGYPFFLVPYGGLVMFRLPIDGDTVSWDTEPVKDGVPYQKWRMEAVLDGDVLKIVRSARTFTGKVVPRYCTAEYYQKGKGKIREVRGLY